LVADFLDKKAAKATDAIAEMRFEKDCATADIEKFESESFHWHMVAVGSKFKKDREEAEKKEQTASDAADAATKEKEDAEKDEKKATGDQAAANKNANAARKIAKALRNAKKK
jgi:hypothetical protein